MEKSLPSISPIDHDSMADKLSQTPASEQMHDKLTGG